MCPARALLLLLLVSACSQPRRSVVPDAALDGPDAADEYYAMKRRGSADPQRAYAIARAQMHGMQRFSTAAESTTIGDPPAAHLSWTFLGPGNIGGRTRTLIIDPADNDVMVSGGVSGGVWKTVNGGARWEPIGDILANLAVNSLTIDPRDHNVLYAGTGEGYFREEVRGTGLPLRGNGIFVTRDAGATWQQLPSTATPDFQWVNDLAISARDSQRIYAATRSGVWRSADGGQQWKNVLPTTVKGGCLDLLLRTDAVDGDYVYASCGTFEQATVYRNLHAETDWPWTAVLSEPGMGRTSLAIAPSKPSTIYALSASNVGDIEKNQALLAVFRSDSNGDPGTWSARVRNDDPQTLNTLLLTNVIAASNKACGGDSNSFITMGWYCNTIAVDPADPERVFAGGVDLFRSDDGGRSWGLASYWWGSQQSFMHADQHNIVFHPRYNGTTNQTLFLTNDGGVWRTDNALARTARSADAPCDPSLSQVVFHSLAHNFGVTQFYHGAVFPDGKRFIGGAQDNSTLIGDLANGTDGWIVRVGGDGAFVAIDPADPNRVYASFQNANLFRSDDGGKEFPFSARRGLNDNFLFITPFTLDANQPSRLWIGGRFIWKTEDAGANWRQASTSLDGQVSAIAVAPHQSNFVIAGTTSGAVYWNASATSSTSSAQWNRVSPREGWVSSLTFDPLDPTMIYATYAGFGGTHVWKSIDAGKSWSALEGSGAGKLPDLPVHSLAIDPLRRDHLYLGTDLGVFVSSDGGATWQVEDGLAPVVTEWVTIGQGARGPAVYAFTHGRGAWRAELARESRRRAVRQH